MVLENYHDPVETVFNQINKMLAKKGGSNATIDADLCHLLSVKLTSEITFSEF